MPVRTYLSQVILWFRRLSTRERILVTILASAFLMLIPVYIGTSIRDVTKSSETKVVRARADFETLQSSIDRYKQLRSKRDELTTKYLSSSVTYEKLTSYLDKVVKRELSDATYELKPSKDDVKISDNFLAKKYSLKIKEALFAELPSLLKSLEDGPPPLFIQRMDISKSPSLGKISIQLEVVTIEEGKPESDLGAP
jgi:hypothetical protein